MHISDEALSTLANRVGRELLRTQRTITTAESCTGGFVSKCLTDIVGSSMWLEVGFVTYSNSAKAALLRVSGRTLQIEGAVSRETAEAMSRGALRVSGADVAVAVTGIAGPGGGSAAKPVGTVWFAWAIRRGRGIQITANMKRFRGDRDAVRRKSVRHALRGVLGLIQVSKTSHTVYGSSRMKTLRKSAI